MRKEMKNIILQDIVPYVVREGNLVSISVDDMERSVDKICSLIIERLPKKQTKMVKTMGSGETLSLKSRGYNQAIDDMNKELKGK